MKDHTKNTPARQNVVDKVASGERASLADESLTPQKKMEAEQKRMQLKSDQPSDRKEEDRQLAHLGNKEVLTPGRKVERNSQDKAKE